MARLGVEKGRRPERCLAVVEGPLGGERDLRELNVVELGRWKHCQAKIVFLDPPLLVVVVLA